MCALHYQHLPTGQITSPLFTITKNIGHVSCVVRMYHTIYLARCLVPERSGSYYSMITSKRSIEGALIGSTCIVGPLRVRRKDLSIVVQGLHSMIVC